MAETVDRSCRRFLPGVVLTLDTFIRTYSDALVRFAYTFVHDSAAAEDIAAEAVAIFYIKAKKFPDEAHLRAYLYRIARSKAVDYLRRHKNLVPLEDLENVLATGSVEQDLFRRERDIVLYRCLGKLPRQYALVLQLSYLEDLPIKEVCTVLGLRQKQVYNLLSRAKTSLRNLLEKEGITREDL
jgi:RNA polymerase sigma-70 factor (ECF subfamily)